MNNRTRTVFSLSIPGVIGGVFLAIMGCYTFGIGVSMAADLEAGKEVLFPPWVAIATGLGFIFLAVLFTTGIVSYFGATVIQPLIWGREQAPEGDPFAYDPRMAEEEARAELEAHIDDDDNPEYQDD